MSQEDQGSLILIEFPWPSQIPQDLLLPLEKNARLLVWQELSPEEKMGALAQAKALVTLSPEQELGHRWESRMPALEFLQTLTAGVDHVDFRALPEKTLACCNAGAYARPIAEHALGMALAILKKFYANHEKLRQGIFDQMAFSGSLYGKTLGIFGYGGIGRAMAQLCRAFDMRILGVNRSGKSSEPPDFLGTMADLPKILREADVFLVSCPLTRETLGAIGKNELALMKEDALFINVARGEIVHEEALYTHLKTHPLFHAAIDAWWVEPMRHGDFRLRFPFLELENVLGSPHNSPLVPGALEHSLRQAMENAAAWLDGKSPRWVVDKKIQLSTEEKR